MLKLSLSDSNMKDIYNRMHINSFTYRAVGTPSQRYIGGFEKLFGKYTESYNNNELFLSINRFDELTIRYNESYNKPIYYPEDITIERLNIDTDTSSFSTYNYIKNHVLKQNLKKINIFTGGRGFNYHIPLIPKKYPYSTAIEQTKLQCKIKAVIEYILNVTEPSNFLSGIDIPVTTDVRRITRVIGNTYFSSKHLEYNNKGRHTVVFQDNEYTCDMSKIIKRSINNNSFLPDIDKNPYTLDSFIDEHNIKIDYRAIPEESVVRNMNPGTSDDVDFYLRLLESKPYGSNRVLYPCVAWNMRTETPKHLSRFSFAVFLRNIGKNTEDIINIYSKLADMYKYVDRYNISKRNTNIASTAKYIHQPSCAKCMLAGICIGKLCPKYKPYNC